MIFGNIMRVGQALQQAALKSYAVSNLGGFQDPKG